ncbi:MAG: 3-dehydroquinate synthase [Pelotomaculum sp.]|nr:3-dehydroquinate synthase [Pelotomaculum sp.]
METVNVNLGKRSYPIYAGPGILQDLGELLGGLPVGRKVLLISNPTVFSLYGEKAAESLVRAGFTVAVAEIGDGEEHKTLATAGRLYDRAFEAGLDRRSSIVALGGGVVGDVAGFVAATYMRGISFVQVPTTLLAQVDSSVGGKVAVNHPRGKNIIGAFYQPRLVLADVDTLKTLPVRQMRSGLAEVIKYGVIWSREFFAWLEQNIEALLNGEAGALAYAVRESCRIKAQVVEQDETEQGLRAVLNYGHTVGHAVEALTDYRVYTHGEAVGIGMAVEARLAVALGMLKRSEGGRIIRLIRQAGLPEGLPEGLPPEKTVEKFYHDKKAVEGQLTFVLPERIGRAVVKNGLAKNFLLEFLSAGYGLLERGAGRV